ncbi:RNA-directed DNA polymerase, eukaryota [Tanacetum coccineum]
MLQIKILLDVVGTSGYRCGVLRSFSVERIEQGIGLCSKKLFHANVGVGSWFSQLIQASMDFTIEGRVVWVEIEGDLQLEDTGICGGESDVEEVPETMFEERLQNNNNPEEVSTGQKENHSKDPFNIYALLKKKNNIAERDNNSEHSLKNPPCYTSNDGTEAHCKNVEDSKKESGEISQGCYEEEVNNVFKDNCSNKGSKEDVAESVCSGHFKKSVTPREVVIMGDFNEVRYKSERFGLLFNVQGANVFNSFIANVGLEEVPLGGFNKLVEDAWIEAPVDESNAMINMMKKLKYLKQKIRDWNKGNMKSTKNKKAKLKEDLKAVDAIIDKGKGNAEVVKKRMDVFKSLQDMDKLQSLEMAQKANIKWSIEGDENSSFYHGVLNKKRSQLNIRGIIVEGIWTDSQHMVELELEVSKEEIKRAVWDCGIDKSPGPNGFTFGFYRRFWKVIENDVCEAVKHFFTHGDIPKGCNLSFIADRQILDGPFILNEVLHLCKSKKKQSLNFKVDFEKACDSVRWDFLDDVLKMFGFGDKWCNWIQSCLRSLRGLIIINGSPTEEFQFYKGLQQSDLLSPFLFILIMESLHLSFQRVVDAGMFKGISLSPSLNLSHMFYADDVVFVG